ncbi:MAG: hypothetical protein II707_05375, partial [Spirochaetales bacterium]|nr:hypothetical protein [Spirochaetales bacterium]
GLGKCEECKVDPQNEYSMDTSSMDCFAQCQDKAGNIYFTTETSYYNGNDYTTSLCLNMIPYSFVNENDASLVSLAGIDERFDCVRIAMYDGVDTKRVFVLTNKADTSDKDKTVSKVYVYDVALDADGIYNAVQIGDPQAISLDKWSYAQAIAADDFNNIYIAVGAYNVTDVESQGEASDSHLTKPATVSIDFNKSYIMPYKVVVTQEPTGGKTVRLDSSTQIKYNTICSMIDTTFNCEYAEFDDSGVAHFPLKTIISDFSFGIADMRYISGGTFVICNELKYMSPISESYSEYAPWKNVSKGQIILCELSNNSASGRIISSYKNEDGNDVLFAGPCRVGYADRGLIAIFDNGFYVSINDDDENMSYSGENSSLIKLIKSSSGTWETSVESFDPMIISYSPSI